MSTALSPHRITFQTKAELMVVVLAKLGQSTARIQEVTGFTSGRIAYMLNKARRAEGLPFTYREGWRHGKSAEIKTVWRLVSDRITQQTKRTLPEQFVKVIER